MTCFPQQQKNNDVFRQQNHKFIQKILEIYENHSRKKNGGIISRQS